MTKKQAPDPDSVESLEDFFSLKKNLPASFQYKPYANIVDFPKFIQAHLSYVKRYSNNRMSDSYKMRLLEIRDMMIEQQKNKPSKPKKQPK